MFDRVSHRHTALPPPSPERRGGQREKCKYKATRRRMENNMDLSKYASICHLSQSFPRPTRAQPKGILCWWLQRATKSYPSGLLPKVFRFPPILPPECVCRNFYSLIKTQLNYLLSQKTFLAQHRREQITLSTRVPLKPPSVQAQNTQLLITY